MIVIVIAIIALQFTVFEPGLNYNYMYTEPLSYHYYWNYLGVGLIDYR